MKNFWRVNITICVGWYNIPKKLCSSYSYYKLDFKSCLLRFGKNFKFSISFTMCEVWTFINKNCVVHEFTSMNFFCVVSKPFGQFLF
jgi:hypothetical protein